MAFRKLVVVGLVGLASFVFNVATAEDAVGPSPAYAAIDGVSFSDPQSGRTFIDGGRLNLSISEGFAARFAGLGRQDRPVSSNRDAFRRYEVAIVASGGVVGVPVEVSIAQRGALGVNENGDIASQSQGQELRLGRGLANIRRGNSTGAPAWYFFAASDDEALVWQPGARSAFGGQRSSFAVQDRVEIGDMQAGITYERGRVQASLAYVEREISVRTYGARTVSSDESFTGLTLTMRH